MPLIRLLAILALVSVAAPCQTSRSDILVKLAGGQPSAIALPEFRAAGATAALMGVFNRTVLEDIEGPGIFSIPPRSLYPLDPPRHDADWRAATSVAASGCAGRCLSDWRAPPVSANYIGFGYGAGQGGRFVAFGYFYATAVGDLEGARVFRKLYTADLTEPGVRKAAHDFAADILARFGVPSLAETKIYFVSDRMGRGTRELCRMDFDGGSQRVLTSLRSIVYNPAVSPDGKRIAFSALQGGGWGIRMYSVESGRYLPFQNLNASTNTAPSFTPDSQVLFASTLSGTMQLYVSGLDGGNPRPIFETRSIDTEPRVNPRTGTDLIFVSGRGGRHQIYLSSIHGGEARRLSEGKGYAGNPAWHPGGRFIAYSGTGGPEPGNWNLFLLDVSSGELTQLTHGAGRNENPTWAPDGLRIAFSSTRGSTSQIWSMRADGKHLRQLTDEGNNWMPVWSK